MFTLRIYSITPIIGFSHKSNCLKIDPISKITVSVNGEKIQFVS